MLKKYKFLAFILVGVVLSVSLKNQNFTLINIQPNSPQTIAVAQGEIIKGKIPTTIMPCLPQNSNVKQLEMEAHTKDKQTDFYIISVTEEVPSNYFEGETDIITRTTVVKQDSIGCLVVVPREKSEKQTLTRYVPLNVARQLSLNFTKRRIELAGSKEAFQKSFEDILQDAADGPWIFFPEDAWAYEQLGLELPNPHVIVDSADDPKAQPPTPGIE